MIKLMLSEIAAAVGGRSRTEVPAFSAQGISTDTRTLQPGEVFFAIAGPNFDGHDFVSAALEKGAIAAVVAANRAEGVRHTMIAKKVITSMREGLRPIVCVGETLEEREAGQTLDVVQKQVLAFRGALAENPGYGVIAYEPVWAIGTGKVARAEDAQEVHAMIRKLLTAASDELADATRILYGGSVKADNAAGLLGQEDIDGALVGGASLDAKGFAKIAEAGQRVAETRA